MRCEYWRPQRLLKRILKNPADETIIHIGKKDIQNRNIDTLNKIKEIATNIHEKTTTTK